MSTAIPRRHDSWLGFVNGTRIMSRSTTGESAYAMIAPTANGISEPIAMKTMTQTNAIEPIQSASRARCAVMRIILRVPGRR